jgi:hypothetical protein
VRGSNLYWESRRIVLRGASLQALAAEVIPEVRSAEASVIIPAPALEQLAISDRYGVAMVADLRRSPSLVDEITQLAGHPSAAIVLLSLEQIAAEDVPPLAAGVLLAAYVRAGDRAPAWANVVAFELWPGERPSQTLADSGKPIIVIRRGEVYADISAARAACDRLQAELAPEFDLAGYFVAP